MKDQTMTNEDIQKMWADQDLCPDFKPVLDDVLNERTRLKIAIEKLKTAANDELRRKDEQIKYLEAECKRNEHNLSIDQTIADQIKELGEYKKMWQEIAGAANLKALMKRLTSAENIVNDIVMMNDHIDWCNSKRGEPCSCMDVNYYNPSSLLIRAQAHEKSWGL